MLNPFLKAGESAHAQIVSPLVLKLSLFLVTAVAAHLVMSFGQTLIHYKVAHNPMGGKICRNHLVFHHTHYSDDHLVSEPHLGDEGKYDALLLHSCSSSRRVRLLVIATRSCT